MTITILKLFVILVLSLNIHHCKAAHFQRDEELITSIKLLPEKRQNGSSIVTNLSTDSSEEDTSSGERSVSKEDISRMREREEVECHRSAVWRCGHIFIRVHKFFDYLSSRESFHPRCAVRNAFFNCLKVSKEKSCGRSPRKKVPNSDRFRQRLANTLWSTRTCLLGIEYYG